MSNRQIVGKLLDPPPSGLARETVESFLKQVDLQLELAKSLVDTYPSFEDALKIHRMLHDRIRELADIGDACVAQWTDFEDEEKNVWVKESEVQINISETLKPKKSSRWTLEELHLLETALLTLDTKKRGSALQLSKIIKTKTTYQIREKVRRMKNKEKIAAAAATSNSVSSNGQGIKS